MADDQVEVHVVSHTHWDREWYLTREQFRLRLVDLVDHVLDRLDSDPRFTAFHLDGQTIVLEDYLEVRPEHEERLRGHVAAGRLLVGPWYVMPDQFLVSGEALVRNLALGHRIAERFGKAMPVGYIPDPFGHVAQMPQILRQLGLDNAVLWRGVGGSKAESLWEGLDGSRVLLLHLPREGYANAMRLPSLPPDEMRSRARELLAREGARSSVGQVLFMAGVDHVEPHPGLTDLVDCLAAEPGARARLSTLPAYVEGVRWALGARGGPDLLETVRGELRGGQDHAFLLPGVLSARSHLKLANARAQTALEVWAEPLSVFAWMLGEPYPSGLLAYGWKTLLQNHPHDSICGCSVDAVHAENLTRFARATEVAEGVAERALAALARRVEPPPEGALRVVLVNTDAAPYRGVVTGTVELPFASADPGRTVAPERLDRPARLVPRDARLTAVTDADGRRVAFQVLAEEDVLVHLTSRFEPPWPVRARRLQLAIWVPAVPACGYAACDLRLAVGEAAAAPPAPAPVASGEDWMDNGLVRVAAGPDGTLEVRDLRRAAVYSRCGELEDAGDVGDEYTFSPPVSDRLVTSAEARLPVVRRIEPGPLRATLRIDLELPVPSAATDDRCGRRDDTVMLPVSIRVSLEAGSPRVEWTMTVDNAARDHRLRVLFPTAAATVTSARAATAFGVVDRPARPSPPPPGALEDPVGTAPLQGFVDAGDGQAGVFVLAEGLAEYEVVAEPGPARVAITLLRCVGALSRDGLRTRRGHAGPALPTPGAQCPGRHIFRFAMVPRGAPPEAGQLYAWSRAFLVPPRMVAAPDAAGTTQAPRSFLRIEPEQAGVALSAVKKTDDRDSLVVRIFNPQDTEARVRIHAGTGLAQAFALDLLERRETELLLGGGAAEAVLGPARIATFELVPTRSL